jgi:hypothetical protein
LRRRRRGEGRRREQDERECSGSARRGRIHHAEDTARGAFSFPACAMMVPCRLCRRSDGRRR